MFAIIGVLRGSERVLYDECVLLTLVELKAVPPESII